MDTPTSWALKLGAQPPLEWTDAHERVLRDSDTLWDDLRWVWIRARKLEEAAEDATGDADLLAARDAYREVDGLSQLRAGHLRMVARDTFRAFADRLRMKAKKDAKIDGEKIYLG